MSIIGKLIIGILRVAGLIAAPFTFWAGIVVSIVVIGGAGGMVMSGSKVVEIILESLGLKEVQAAIEDDREACSELQKQLDSLENFISSLAEFIKPLHDDAVLLRELERSGFEFLSRRISYEGIGTSTEERVKFGARFFRAATSACSHNICISGRYFTRSGQERASRGDARGTRSWLWFWISRYSSNHLRSCIVDPHLPLYKISGGFLTNLKAQIKGKSKVWWRASLMRNLPRRIIRWTMTRNRSRIETVMIVTSRINKMMT